MPEQPLRVSLEEIDHHPSQFTLIFNSSHYPITLNPETNVTFSDWLRRLQPVLTGQSDPAGEVAPQELLHDVGTWLWQALLPDGAPAQERDTLAQALRQGRTPVLLALPDALAGLPWELLCDPLQPAEQGFIARRRPFMRLVATDTSTARVTPPLRVLLLISSPPGLGEDSRVDVESERAAVEQATQEMREAGLLHLLVEDIVTPKRVQQALVRFKPHMLHYIGHGGYDEKTGGVLLWEDDQGNEFPLSAAHLADMLRPRNLHAVVLHACETGRSNARTDMRSLAGTLLHEGIPAVIAQQANFSYESSQRASEAWYTALTARQGFAQALFEVRLALSQADRPDWAAPILQGNTASPVPLLDDAARPGPPDPLLARQGAAADLPAPAGVFVGRHRELRELRLMLEHVPSSGPVLALITGPGGVGKSTLAALAVTRYGGKYKGALTLSCQGYQSVELFLQHMGEFLKRLGAPGFLEQMLPNPKLSTEAKIEEAIAALNSVGPVLLVVDNLESVQTEDQTLRDAYLLYLLQKLLTNLHGGRVLITGRYAVKDLLPHGKFAAYLLRLDLDDLSPYETHQLLMSHPTLAPLSEIVRQKLVQEFGGLPYVYDLISSKAAIEDLEQIIYEIREYGAVKQKTITEERKQYSAKEWQKVHRAVVEFATLEAIVNRLSQPSKILLEQLGVLSQPFPLVAIEQGLGADRAAWQPLLDWSLLHYDQLEQTYRLHSITRLYAEGLLEEQSRKQAQVQLAMWYEHYAAQNSHNLADYLEEHRLLRAAGRVQQAGQLVGQLAGGLMRYGLYSLLRDLCTKTLSDIRESDEQLAASALEDLGQLAYLQGKYEQARSFYQQSLDIFERLANQRGRAYSLDDLGLIAYAQGKYAEAQVLCQQSLTIFEQLEDEYGQAASLFRLGTIAQDMGEYDEARDLYRQSLDIFERLEDQSGRAGTLQSLGIIARNQGEYDEARDLYWQSLDIFERLEDQSGRANTLYQLGIIAFLQGQYDEAQSLNRQSLDIDKRLGNQLGLGNCLHQLGLIAYAQGKQEEAQVLCQQSLDIFEQIGYQNGRARSLAQLGQLAYEQGHFEKALMFAIRAYILFEGIGSPDSALTQRLITRIRSHMDEKTFMTHWQALAGDHPLPMLPIEDIRQLLLQVIIDFIQAPTWVESKRVLEAHPGLLRPEIDVLLQELAAQQEQEGVRKVIEKYRLLLAQCRIKGIDAAFADLQVAQNAFTANLNRLCSEVVATLRTGNAEQCEALATRIEQMLKDDLPIEGVQDFLQVLIAWLREQGTHTLQEKLQPRFRDAYARMAAAMEQEETEYTEENDRLTIGDLPRVASSLILQGTAEQRQQLATALMEAQQHLPPVEASLGRFFGCLAAGLRGETPEVASLEAPFTELWQAFQDALRAAPGEESSQGEEKHG